MPKVYGVTNEQIPASSSDGSSSAVRLDAYGATHVVSELLSWSREGSYFRACNSSFGTGLAHGIQTSFSDTANVLLVQRNGSATKKIIPHYTRLICTVAGASTTAAHLGIIADTANRYSSGGTDLSGNIVCANTGLGPGSACDVLRFGAVTAAAAVAKRQLSRLMLKTQAAPCWTVGDEVLVYYLPNDHPPGPLSGSAALRIVQSAGPVVLGGQNHCLLLHQWNTANATTAPSFEVEHAWWER